MDNDQAHQDSTPDDRGQGSRDSVIAADLEKPARRRSTAKMLQDALDGLPSVADDPVFWRPILSALASGACDARDARGAAACASVLARLRGQQLDAIERLDRVERADRDAADGTGTIKLRAGQVIRLETE